jgi:hypothetical protein
MSTSNFESKLPTHSTHMSTVKQTVTSALIIPYNPVQSITDQTTLYDTTTLSKMTSTSIDFISTVNYDIGTISTHKVLPTFSQSAETTHETASDTSITITHNSVKTLSLIVINNEITTDDNTAYTTNEHLPTSFNKMAVFSYFDWMFWRLATNIYLI